MAPAWRSGSGTRRPATARSRRCTGDGDGAARRCARPSDLRPVVRLAAFLAHDHAPSQLVHAVRDPRRLLAPIADEHDVAVGDRAVGVDDAALDIAFHAGLGVTLEEVYPPPRNPLLLGE